MEDYIRQVLRTESIDFDKIRNRLNDDTTIRLLHAAIGKVTEAGEFIDILKKHIFYGKDFDYINALEEIGDGQWYDGIACDALNSNFDYIQKTNIAKLQKRYPEKFMEENAINRNVDNELKVFNNE
jgi:hypothetical protein